MHKLSARTGLQWAASLLGVVAVGAAAFATLALVKGDKKFEREVVQPARRWLAGGKQE